MQTLAKALLASLWIKIVAWTLSRRPAEVLFFSRVRRILVVPCRGGISCIRSAISATMRRSRSIPIRHIRNNEENQINSVSCKMIRDCPDTRGHQGDQGLLEHHFRALQRNGVNRRRSKPCRAAL